MPAYSNTYPPSALPENVIGYSWGIFSELNALGSREAYELLPTILPAAGARFGLQVPQPSENDGGRRVSWQTLYNGTMTNVNCYLEGALEDVDSEYFQLDATTNPLGELRSVLVRCKFLRVRYVGGTAGTATGLIAKILG
jgi:hypothetical protein